MKAPLEDRFWAKVAKRGPDDCWEWTAYRNPKGYGRFSIDGTLVVAHRHSWELHFGPIPPGQCVLHDCDNPPCQNPEHLFLGTNAENNADKETKGRGAHPVGTENGQSKLTDAEVLEIRAIYAAGGVSHRGLARRFGVSCTNIGRIVRGDGWRHLA